MIRNILNGKVYVGSGCVTSSRWAAHRGLLDRGNHHSRALLADWQRQGKEAFEFSVLEEIIDTELLAEREQYWMDKYESWNPVKGYNVKRVAARRGSQIDEVPILKLYRRGNRWWIRFSAPPWLLRRFRAALAKGNNRFRPSKKGEVNVSLGPLDKREATIFLAKFQVLLWLARWDALSPAVERAFEMAQQRGMEAAFERIPDSKMKDSMRLLLGGK